ncbi:MAG: hypothetical protein AAF557_24765, partial [Pseudomonadota bacterium]
MLKFKLISITFVASIVFGLPVVGCNTGFYYFLDFSFMIIFFHSIYRPSFWLEDDNIGSLGKILGIFILVFIGLSIGVGINLLVGHPEFCFGA